MGKNWNCISIIRAFPRKAKHGSVWNATPRICEGVCPVPSSLFHFHHLPSLETFCPNNSQPQPSSFSVGAGGDWGCLDSGGRRCRWQRWWVLGGRSHLPSIYGQGETMRPAVMKPYFSLPVVTQGVIQCAELLVSHGNASGSQCWPILTVFSQWWHWLIVFTSFKWYHLVFSQELVAEQGDIGTSVIWCDHHFALEERACARTPFRSPFQNVCAGTAINRAVLTRRCNPSRSSLGLIYIILSGPREHRCTPGREGTACARGNGFVPSLLARGGDCGQSWVMICHRKGWGVSLCGGNLGRDWQQGCFLPLPLLLTGNNEALSVHHGHGYARLCRLLGLLLYHAGIRQPSGAPK